MPYRIPVPSGVLEEHDWWVALEGYLPKLKERDRRIVAMRYGLKGSQIHTLRETAAEFNVTEERIRQICGNARWRVKAMQELGSDTEPLSLDSDVFCLNIGALACGALKRYGIVRVRDLIEHSQDDLLNDVPNFGVGSLAEVNSALAQHNWRLRQ